MSEAETSRDFDHVAAETPAPGTRRRRRAVALSGQRQWIIVGGLFAVVAVVGLTLSIVMRAPGPSHKTVTASGPVPPRGPSTVVYDTFDRPDTAASLSKAQTNQAWAVVGAPWAIESGQARVAKADAGKRSVAVVDAGIADGVVQVTFAKVVAGGGLVFRFKDPGDFFAFTAAPKFGTWNLQKTSGGTITNLGNVGIIGATDGTTISVRFVGDQITVTVNGVDQRAYVDGDLTTETRVGLLGVADNALAGRWDNFVTSSVISPAVGSAPTISAESSAPASSSSK